MPSRVNKLMVKETVERYRSAGCMVAVAYTGLDAASATALREKLRQSEVDLRVVKNRIARIAMRELGREDFAGLLDGQTAVMACDDVLGASKAAVEFAKERKLEIKGGWADGRTLSKQDVKRLATIPPREVLMGQIAGLAVAPSAGLAGVIRATYASIARALRAWGEKRGDGENPADGQRPEDNQGPQDNEKPGGEDSPGGDDRREGSE